jgi:type IV pilus biogenesis protein CpaD/CtpE
MAMTQLPYLFVFLAALALSACAARDRDYAGRNNLDYARAECLRLAQSSGYSDVAVDGVERDGSAEWKVRLRMRAEGKDKTERCEYNARTDRAHLS